LKSARTHAIEKIWNARLLIKQCFISKNFLTCFMSSIVKQAEALIAEQVSNVSLY